MLAQLAIVGQTPMALDPTGISVHMAATAKAARTSYAEPPHPLVIVTNCIDERTEDSGRDGPRRYAKPGCQLPGFPLNGFAVQSILKTSYLPL